MTMTAAVEKQTTALTAPTANVGRELQFYGLDREKVELLKRTVAKGATDDQFALFMTIAQRRKLDPFAKQIWCVLRKNKDGSVEMSVQTAIDGFRVIAQRTGEYDGQDPPEWCGEDGVWKDVWLDTKNPPKAARVMVYRKGVSRPSPGIAHLESYAAYKDDGKTMTAKWQQMPEHMLAKCAEALALRKAFPEDLSGLYTDDEMEHGNVIDAISVEKLPVATKQEAEVQVDTWAAFLADLATAPGAAAYAEAFGSLLSQWTEEEIVASFQRMFADHDEVKPLNDAVGPWFAIIDRHAKVASRVAKLKEPLIASYKARTSAIREAAKAAQNGGQS
jgi:phage recombination protein Bet